MWGQESTSWGAVVVIRIIPTRVGTSNRIRYVLNKGEDHPHACGDKATDIIGFAPALGSSPRVWGQADVEYSTTESSRIIPTRVGTRCCQCLSQACPRDHPHACGDKVKQNFCVVTGGGSSPRVWGQGLT